jgi:3-oxocholest-4-en-26-oyl-CoA dehydrogenase alpha subunit
VRDGDEYLVNGSKVFTSGANQADFIWLAVRTDPDVAKHTGISILAVPTSSPGFSWSPIVTVGSIVTTATYYSDVRVPLSSRIGQENEGWRMITNQLNHERVGLAAMGGLAHRLLDEVTDWTRSEPAGHDGGRLIDVPWVQMDLARAHARMEAMKLLNWRMTTALDAGSLSPADSSAVRVYGTECLIDTYRLLLGIMGPVGYLRQGSPGAALRGRLEQASRSAQINTFGGGVNEVQREIVAAAGLGMARQAR